MALELSPEERDLAAGRRGEGVATAARIVAEAARLLGAERLVPIVSAHIDGCLYHGPAGLRFAETLVERGARVSVPTTLNVGALNLGRPDQARLSAAARAEAFRQTRAYEALGCRATWTCSPYQAGHRPAKGAQVAWGESNAVAFCNSVLGARTNRYGDLLDIACAIAGRAPETGLHKTENRRARALFDLSGVSDRLKSEDAFWPVLGALLGARAGERPAAIAGVAAAATEDRLKALGAAAASFGSVALFHVVGATPEAASLEEACGGAPEDLLEERIVVDAAMLRAARDQLSTTAEDRVSAVAIGSPHLSLAEAEALIEALDGRRVALPFYANTGRHVVAALEARGRLAALEAAGVTLVVDTCIVVTPILPPGDGALLTNSGKFAHYAPGNTGHAALYGSLRDCVETAVAGRLVRDEGLWA